MKSKKDVAVELQVLEVQQDGLEIYLVGTTPLIHNRMAEKARQQILLPRARMNRFERSTTLKHDPPAEFRSSAHTIPSGPTFLGMPSSSFKRSLASAALDMPGVSRSVIGRLTFVEGEMVHVYGVPKLFMSVVRSADINKTPDIRTRAILPHWCAKIHLSYVRPLLNQKSVVGLLAAAGLYVGIGDWRSEKGAGNYGQFRICDKNDKEFAQIARTGARKQQLEAMAHPVCYNGESSELLAWYVTEVERRGFDDRGRKTKDREQIPTGKRGRAPRVNGSEIPASKDVVAM